MRVVGRAVSAAGAGDAPHEAAARCARRGAHPPRVARDPRARSPAPRRALRRHLIVINNSTRSNYGSVACALLLHAIVALK